MFVIVFKKTIGPGPAHAIDPTITNKGKDGTPHYSLSSRHKELVPFNTPGPGTYGPEKKATCFQGEKQPPAYSVGGRSKYRRRKQSFITNYHTYFNIFSLVPRAHGNLQLFHVIAYVKLELARITLDR